MPVITAADLRRFAPKADPRIVAAFVAHGDAAFQRWGITTTPRLRMFMGQVKVESANLTSVFENMNYSAERLHAVWPKRFPTVASAAPYAHKPEALANKVYGGRLGNVGPNDGWLARGQGLIMTTGLTNIGALARHMGASIDDTRARLTSDDGMVDCAAATFHMLGCLPFADKADLIGATHKINGGLIGLTDRRLAVDLAAKVWPTIRSFEAARPAAAPAPANDNPLPHPSFADWLGSFFRKAA